MFFKFNSSAQLSVISRTVSRADFVDVINQLRLRQISSSNNISNIPISVLVIPAGLNIRRYSNEDLINMLGKYK